MPTSHWRHGQDKTVLCCPCRRCEQNWRHVKTVGNRKFWNCFVQSRNAVRTTENSLDLLPILFTPPIQTRQASVSVVWTRIYSRLHCVVFSDRSWSRGVFYFGHAESLVPVLTALGLFRDRQPLASDMFHTPSLADARKFRTSAFMPFSANLALILYDCVKGQVKGTGRTSSNDVDMLIDVTSSGDQFVTNVSSADRYFVQLLVNERPVKFPSCGGTICSYTQIRKYYSAYVDKCNFSHRCQLDTETQKT